MTYVTGYDSVGREIPTETGGTDLSGAEQQRLNQQTNTTSPTRAPTIAQTNLAIVQKLTGEDKKIAAAKASEDRKQVLYGAGGPFQAGAVAGENPLHQFASFNYNLSLHALTKGEYNGVIKGFASPSNTLIHTSGGYRNSRAPEFTEDFFIDDLEMECTVSPDGMTQTTNALYYKFKIIEPMGMTLMNRIVAMAARIGYGANWVQIPYALIIEFQGYLDDGTPVNLYDQKKIVPVKILNMDVRPSAKGTEYNVEAVAYSGEAFNKTVGTTPCGIESDARTLEDFFRSDEKVGVGTDGRPENTEEVFGGEKEKQYKVRSFVSAYNNWQKDQVKNNRADVADEIYVVFGKEILEKQQLVDREVAQADKAPIVDVERQKVYGKQMTNADPGGPKPTSSSFSFAAGSNMSAVIDSMMQQTKYWRDQVAEFTKDKEKTIAPSGVVKGWKIVPKVEIKDWDKSRGRYAYKITYYVRTHVKYNREDPNLPKSFPKVVARTYSYQYTGQNKDILQWDVKFDMAYHAKELVYPQKNSAVAGPQPQASQTEKLEASKKAIIGRSVAQEGAGPGEPIGSNEVNPGQIEKVSDSEYATGANGIKDGVGMIAAQAFSNIYNRTREMLAADITIVGDPSFIVQDEVAKDPAEDIDVPSSEYVNGAVSDSTGGVYVNKGEVHLRLIWKAPTDLQEETGSYSGNAGFNQVILNGLWKVITIKCRFQRGTFTQQLALVRLFNQEEELGKADTALGLTARDITTFPSLQPKGNVLVSDSRVQTDYKDYAPYRRGTSAPEQFSLATTDPPVNELRNSFQTFETLNVPAANAQGVAAFGQRYDIPTSIANPAVDPFNLPTGVAIDPATGLPQYQNNLYTGGQKDIAAWKAAVDAKQPFSYTNTRPNGNTGIATFTPT